MFDCQAGLKCKMMLTSLRFIGIPMLMVDWNLPAAAKTIFSYFKFGASLSIFSQATLKA